MLLDSLRHRVFRKLPNTADELDRLLCDWARHHHLDYAWVLEEARFLYGYSRIPNSNELFPATFESTWPVYDAPPFQMPPWAPNENLVRYRKRVLAKFKKFLDDSIRKYKLSRKPLQDRGSQAAHYRWAAEHVCLKWKWGKIARKNGTHVTWQAVGKAVRPILTKIGIPESTT